jgi:hypothetical protein
MFSEEGVSFMAAGLAGGGAGGIAHAANSKKTAPAIIIFRMMGMFLFLQPVSANQCARYLAKVPHRRLRRVEQHLGIPAAVVIAGAHEQESLHHK